MLELEKLKQIANGERVIDRGVMVPTELLVDMIDELERRATALKKAHSILEDEYPVTDYRHPKVWGLTTLLEAMK